MLVDLGSKAGCKIDDNNLESCIPAQIKSNGSKIIFGLSSRTYQVTIDYSKMQKAVELEQKNLEREMRLLQHLDDAENINVDTLKTTLGLIK